MTSLRVDADLCQGHGRCYSLAPALFESDDEGYGIVVDAGAVGWAADDVRRVAEACPEGAVRVVDEPTAHSSIQR